MKASVRLGLLGLFAVLAAAFGLTQLPGTVEAQPAGVTKTCTTGAPAPGGTPVVSPATVTTGTTIFCSITIGATAVTVVGNPITISVTGATITAASATGGTGADVIGATFTANTIVVTCLGATCDAGPPPAGAPIVITESLVATGGPITETFTSSTTGSVVFTGPVINAVSAGLVTGIAVNCPSSPTAPAPGVLGGTIPGQIGGLGTTFGIGILPAALVCTATPLIGAPPAAGTSVPGTFEVTSVNGVLLDAAGNLQSNLRIACGNAASAAPSCVGVQFAVLGLGVGLVEVRVRFEPAAVVVGQPPIEVAGVVGFIAPAITVSLLLSPNPVIVGQTGAAVARFNRTFNCAAAFGVTGAAGINATVCIDPTTGLPIAFNFGSGLNGNVVFSIDNSAIASWVDATTATPAATPQVAGFVATANQVVRRCGFFPTTGLPATAIAPFTPGGPLANFFGGCDSAQANYRGNIPGVTNVTASFIPDLPGAFGTNLAGLTQPVAALIGLFGQGVNPVQSRVLEVVAPAPSGIIQLARGCNNVSPTVTESSAAYAARVTPQGALVAIWEHQAATNTFRGFSPQAGAPNDLPGVTRLRPVFVCVSAAAQLDQPPA